MAVASIPRPTTIYVREERAWATPIASFVFQTAAQCTEFTEAVFQHIATEAAKPEDARSFPGITRIWRADEDAFSQDTLATTLDSECICSIMPYAGTTLGKISTIQGLIEEVTQLLQTQDPTFACPAVTPIHPSWRQRSVSVA
ncbi:MAG: hypothetical protein HY069_01235 [Chlamydiia bacterium]|nr:hypothetical protein [Chlamydiia bacterium]